MRRGSGGECSIWPRLVCSVPFRLSRLRLGRESPHRRVGHGVSLTERRRSNPVARPGPGAAKLPELAVAESFGYLRARLTSHRLRPRGWRRGSKSTTPAKHPRVGVSLCPSVVGKSEARPDRGRAKAKSRGGFSENPIANVGGQAKLLSRSKTRLLSRSKAPRRKTFFAPPPLALSRPRCKNWGWTKPHNAPPNAPPTNF
jgi:hypothetical protein